MTTRRSRFAGAAAVAAGCVVGAMLFAPQLSGAQEDSTTTSTLDETTTTVDGTPAAEAPEGTGPDAPFGKHRVGPGLDVAAETIGISVDDLRAALRDGQTIAEVAEANGVDPLEVTDALVEQAKTRIEEQLAELPDRIDGFVNGTFEARGGRFPGGPGGPGKHGPFGGHPHGPDAERGAAPEGDGGD